VLLADNGHKPSAANRRKALSSAYRPCNYDGPEVRPADGSALISRQTEGDFTGRSTTPLIQVRPCQNCDGSVQRPPQEVAFGTRIGG
jgi:hypothetical protein